MRVLYLDILLITNLVIDYLLLRSAALMLGRRGSGLRVYAGAVVSSLSSLIILLPQLKPLPLFAVKLCVAGLVCAAAFGFSSFRGWLKSCAVFIFVSMVYGGAVYGISIALGSCAVFNNMSFYFESTPLFLVCVITAVYLALSVVLKLWRNRTPQSSSMNITLSTEKGREECLAFVDTGNKLQDPLGEAPVIIISTALAEKLLNEKQLEVCSQLGEKGVSALAFSECRFHLVPYTSIGGEGLLAAFTAVRCELEWCGKKHSIERPLLAVSPRCECSAIIGFDSIKNL